MHTKEQRSDHWPALKLNRSVWSVSFKFSDENAWVLGSWWIIAHSQKFIFKKMCQKQTNTKNKQTKTTRHHACCPLMDFHVWLSLLLLIWNVWNSSEVWNAQGYVLGWGPGQPDLVVGNSPPWLGDWSSVCKIPSNLNHSMIREGHIANCFVYRCNSLNWSSAKEQVTEYFIY